MPFKNLEMLLTMSLVFCYLRPDTWSSKTWNLESYYMSNSTIFLLAFATFVKTACLCTLLLICFAVIVANVMDELSAALAKPFDFFAKSNDDSNIDHLVDCLYPGLCSGYLCISSVCSHDGSQVHSHNHHWFLFLLRSTSILVIVISLLALLFTNLLLEPIQEMSMTPLKFITTMIPFGFKANNTNWRIISVSGIFILKMCLFRTVTTYHWAGLL